MPAKIDLGRYLQDTTPADRARIAKWLNALAADIAAYRPGDEDADWQCEQLFYDQGRETHAPATAKT